MTSPTTSHAGIRSVGTHSYRGRKSMRSAGLHKTKAINAKTNAAMAQSASPVPRHPPTPGQIVAAGLTGGANR